MPASLKFKNPFRVFAGDALGLIAWQRVDPRQATRHVADIVRIIRSVQHVVGRAGNLHAQFECLCVPKTSSGDDFDVGR